MMKRKGGRGGGLYDMDGCYIREKRAVCSASWVAISKSLYHQEECMASKFKRVYSRRIAMKALSEPLVFHTETKILYKKRNEDISAIC
jgi:hypothetical protein